MLFLDQRHLIYVCSPLLRTLKELQSKGIYICDIPVYDTTREFLLLNQLRHAEMGIRYDSYIDGLVQDCSISIANALEILQSYTKPSISPV